MKYTKSVIEKKYNCQLHKDTGFDDSRKFWVAFENEDDSEEQKFTYADGWTLSELVENIEAILNNRI